jgi:hypothetical protein
LSVEERIIYGLSAGVQLGTFGRASVSNQLLKEITWGFLEGFGEMALEELLPNQKDQIAYLYYVGKFILGLNSNPTLEDIKGFHLAIADISIKTGETFKTVLLKEYGVDLDLVSEDLDGLIKEHVSTYEY